MAIPSKRNPYFEGKFTQGTESEQALMDDLINESVEISGIDARYIPRQVGYEDDVLIEDRFSEFKDRYSVVLYLDSFTGFEGESNFFSKFGFEARDELYFTMTQSHWQELVAEVNNDPEVDLVLEDYPPEGDLIYIPMIEGFFEITYTDNTTQFFQIGGLYIFTLKTQRFTFSYEELTVDVDQPYEEPMSGEDPFRQNKDLEDAEPGTIDFSDSNILSGDN